MPRRDCRVPDAKLHRLREAQARWAGLPDKTTSTVLKEPMKHTLTQWNPMRELENFQNRILTAFAPTLSGRGDSSQASEWAPLVDITEDDDAYHISAELPQVNKEDVKVTLESGVLTITGERRFEKEETKRKYHRVERAYGYFSRSFSLPGDGDPSKVEAEFKEGMLNIRVAKSEEARPRQIDVKVS
jgi:HSP20 family protein